MLDDTEQEAAQSVTEGEHRWEALKQPLRDALERGRSLEDRLMGFILLPTVDRRERRRSFSDNPPRPELWAGPSFSNSPAPSSLPIPKFSVPEKPK
ncbi:unnamed protein product [Musa acuminata subsp. malaccensis]|uniref:(wild Malaysian banana) hypothetical protein n=1 Tax=Musa acuminata subsp. malaccensis TaxID=214687 RepID=A0A8D7FLV2_MUSAM|nr:unnamed protein product [Musa acuminata subsp. malaccensis]